MTLGAIAAPILALLLVAVSMSGCESTQDKSRRLSKAGGKLESEKGLTITRTSQDVTVVSKTVLTDANGSAVAVVPFVDVTEIRFLIRRNDRIRERRFGRRVFGKILCKISVYFGFIIYLLLRYQCRIVSQFRQCPFGAKNSCRDFKGTCLQTLRKILVAVS